MHTLLIQLCQTLSNYIRVSVCHTISPVSTLISLWCCYDIRTHTFVPILSTYLLDLYVTRYHLCLHGSVNGSVTAQLYTGLRV
jgi:hypothetical protein